MNQRTDSFTTRCRKGLLLATALYMVSTLLIAEYVDHINHIKELFYSWLLVFLNAYIGIFIANQALKRESGGFFAWAFLGNGIRAGIFLIMLLCVLEWEVLHARGFVLMTFAGYFAFLAVEIYGLQNHMKRISQDLRCDLDDE